ncbi:hypothetical protein B0H21DRAFT_671923, partial [Amylocystis lapponica]
RPYNFQPTLLDFELYQMRQRSLFSRPHARKAAMSGGILWRLAWESGAFAASDLYGPSWEAMNNGQSYDVAAQLFDDSLSEKEADAICGVYEVIASSQSQRPSRKSWWPTPNAWKDCGLDVGYWSNTAEAWFQGRLAIMRAGTAKLQTSQEWKNMLRFSKSHR